MKAANFSILVIFSLCAWSPASSAQGVYVKQGPNGPVFSDQPAPGAKEVTLKPLNVMPAPPAERGEGHEANEAGPKVVTVDTTKQVSDYERLQIVSPENDGSVIANTAVFEVRLAVDPPLRLAEQHAFVISLNGRLVNQRFTATEFMIPPEFWEELPPPNQAMQLDASIVDGKGQILKRADPVQFFLRYTTIYQNPNYPQWPIVRPPPAYRDPDRPGNHHRPRPPGKPPAQPEGREPATEVSGGAAAGGVKRFDR